MLPTLSVLIMTSPGRESCLEQCLERLALQSDVDFELVVVDDGSEGSSGIVERYVHLFPEVVFLWRENDNHVSVSRNLGSTYAQGDWRVCLDSDLLLNEFAIARYRQHAQKLRPAQVLYGAYGQSMEAASRWFPQTRVNWMDSRFVTDGVVKDTKFQGHGQLEKLYFHQEGVWHPHSLLTEPELYAAGANFMIHRDAFEISGGFNEELIRWEDLYFGMSLSLSECEIHFTSDTWTEHQCHSRQLDEVQLEQAYKLFFSVYVTIPDIAYTVSLFTDSSQLAYLDQTNCLAFAQNKGKFGIELNHASSARTALGA